MQQNIGVKPLHGVFKQRFNCSGGLLKLSLVWKSFPRPASIADLNAHVRRDGHTWSLHLTIALYLTRARGDTSSPRGTGIWNREGESEGPQRWKCVPSFKKRLVPLRGGQADEQLVFIVNEAGYRRLWVGYREQMMWRSTMHIKQKENQSDTRGRIRVLSSIPSISKEVGMGWERAEQIWTCTLNLLKD